MNTSKLKLLSFGTFLLLCALIPVASASRMSRFYVKVYANPWDSRPVGDGQYFVGDYKILDFIQWGKIIAEGGNINSPPIGTFQWHIVWIINTITLKNAILFQANMTFSNGQYAGKTLELTGIATAIVFQNPGGGGQVVSGIFSGHGDRMNVAGHLEPIEEISACGFDGYSW